MWGDVPTWLAAVGTCGAVAVSLYLARRDSVRAELQERRHQAELVTAWPGEEMSVDGLIRQEVVIQNSSTQSVYMLIASLVSVQGAFRDTAVPSSPPAEGTRLRIPFQAYIGQIPPGEHRYKIESGGHGMMLKLGVEIAFRDARGARWLRRGDGGLEEVALDPPALYHVMTPVGWLRG